MPRIEIEVQGSFLNALATVNNYPVPLAGGKGSITTNFPPGSTIKCTFYGLARQITKFDAKIDGVNHAMVDPTSPVYMSTSVMSIHKVF